MRQSNLRVLLWLALAWNAVGAEARAFEVKPTLFMRGQERDCLARATTPLSNTFQNDAHANLVAHNSGRGGKGRFTYAGVIRIEGILHKKGPSERLGGLEDYSSRPSGDPALIGPPERRDWLSDNGWSINYERQVGYLPYMCEYLQSDSIEPYSVYAVDLDTIITKAAYGWALELPSESLLSNDRWMEAVKGKLR